MEVQIRRRERESYLPNEVMNEAIVCIGSHFVNRSVLRGLDPDQEKKYLPAIVGVPADHPDFPRKTQDYWADMSIKVPSGGVVLDVTEDSNGEPYNLEDWLRYKWAMRHVKVADSHKGLMEDPRKEFYVFNPEKESLERNKRIELLKMADVTFAKISTDKQKMRRLMTLMSNANVNAMTDVQIENMLYDLKNEDPEKFFRVATDKNLDMKAEILEMIRMNILRKVGSQIIYIDQVIAQELDDAVAFFNDPANSSVVVTLRAKAKEIRGASFRSSKAKEPAPSPAPQPQAKPQPTPQEPAEKQKLEDTPAADPDPVPAEHADKAAQVDDVELQL
jgi:hypothetical protein